MIQIINGSLSNVDLTLTEKVIDNNLTIGTASYYYVFKIVNKLNGYEKIFLPNTDMSDIGDISNSQIRYNRFQIWTNDPFYNTSLKEWNGYNELVMTNLGDNDDTNSQWNYFVYADVPPRPVYGATISISTSAVLLESGRLQLK